MSQPPLETLTERRLNRALLARQGLLEPKAAPLPRVLEDVGGIQTQYAPSGYIGLWSRTAHFERGDLTRALQGKEAIQATLMRMTIHTVSAADYWPMTAGVRRARQAWFARLARSAIGSIDMDQVADFVRDRLRDGPLRQRDIERLLAERGWKPIRINWAGLWVDMVRVPPSGTWESRRADLYGLAEDWLPPQREYTEEEGVDLLVERYLGAFGPATAAEIADWAGVDLTPVKEALARRELARYTDERGKELVDLPGAPLPQEDQPAPVRFLPTWDATLLVHARRTQILPERFRPLVFNTKTPHSIGTFLVDGQVAGTWRYEKGRVETKPFEKLPREAARQVDDEAERLTEFHA